MPSRGDQHDRWSHTEEPVAPAAGRRSFPQESRPLEEPTSPKTLSLTLTLRRLWSGHVVWTREHVVAAIADASDAGAVAGRLLKNSGGHRQRRGPLLRRAAGSPSCSRSTSRLRWPPSWWPRAATRSGSNKPTGRGIATRPISCRSSAGANPHWPEKDVTDLLGQHLTLTKEAAARLEGRLGE
jgi:hypothetical protein